MRRRSLAVPFAAVLTAGALALAACDTDDGRTMQEPSEQQRTALAATAPSTTSTTIAALDLGATTTAAPVVVESAAATMSDVSAAVAASDPVGSGGVLLSGATAAPVDFAAPWSDGAAIDATYTCDGTDEIPLLTWTAPPATTAELALVVVDETTPTPYVHWVVVDLPPEAGAVGGGEPLVMGREGRNSSGTVGWMGPCPPAGESHTYRFTLYLLDAPAEAPASDPPDQLVADIAMAASGEVSLTGTYQRAG